MNEQNKRPQDIKYARKLLHKALNQKDHIRRAAHYEEAYEIIDEYIEDDNYSIHRNYLKNLRLTYTRKLIEGLDSVREKDVEHNLICKYAQLFYVKMGKELQKISEEEPEIYKSFLSYQKFVNSYITP